MKLLNNHADFKIVFKEIKNTALVCHVVTRECINERSSSQQHLEQVSINVIVFHDTDKIPGVCYALDHLMGLGPLVIQAAPLSCPELKGLVLQQDNSLSNELAVQPSGSTMAQKLGQQQACAQLPGHVMAQNHTRRTFQTVKDCGSTTVGCTTSFAGKTPQVTALTESESTLLCTCSMGTWQGGYPAAAEL